MYYNTLYVHVYVFRTVPGTHGTDERDLEAGGSHFTVLVHYKLLLHWEENGAGWRVRKGVREKI